jgi:lipooligosaccharide transport system permease protein
MTAMKLRVLEREARVYRRLWRGSVFSNFVAPLLFLAAMGLGLGGLVDSHSKGVDGLSYLAFIAPGLMAASAMQMAAGESMWSVMGGVKWARIFHAMVATPIRPVDVYGGFLGWVACRAAISSSAFAVIAAVFGGVPSAWGVLAVPGAVLTACAFAAPLMAFSATQETDLSFSVIFRLGIGPLFLFSGTFFPVRQLPAWSRPLSEVSPLWHGVELCRSATRGSLGSAGPLGAIWHVACLCACIAAGWQWGARTFARRLAA